MCRLSQALKKTETCHPTSIKELFEISKDCDIELERFLPNNEAILNNVDEKAGAY